MIGKLAMAELADAKSLRVFIQKVYRFKSCLRDKMKLKTGIIFSINSKVNSIMEQIKFCPTQEKENLVEQILTLQKDKDRITFLQPTPRFKTSEPNLMFLGHSYLEGNGIVDLYFQNNLFNISQSRLIAYKEDNSFVSVYLHEANKMDVYWVKDAFERIKHTKMFL